MSNTEHNTRKDSAMNTWKKIGLCLAAAVYILMELL